MLKKKILSKTAEKIEGLPMFETLDKIQKLERQGENIIHFEIGDPDFNTPRHITKALYDSLKKGETHYTNSMGLYDLRVAISETIAAAKGFTPSVDQVLVTPGANIIINFVIRCAVNPGEEVLIPDPGFSTYSSVVKFCGAVPIGIPLKEENKFRMNPNDIKRAITSKTRLIIINSPNNPTGSLIAPKEMDEIYAIAEKNGIYLLSDEIYSRMVYGDTKFYSPSINDFCKNRTIILDGFSKSFAMTGWRLGMAIGPKEIIEKMGLLAQITYSSVPVFIQRAGIAALKGNQSETTRMTKIYKKRRDLLVDGLNEIPGISCLKNEGAFYVFPNITKTGMTSKQFTDFLLDKAKVAILSGTDFGKYGEGYVRLSYANSIKNIEEAVERIKKVFKN
ncbi:MAG: pyridoxal phosphate-dependent aminotransferase [Patescibacteria group bacterium]|nr:pyridoxal phosphate-dependent aminotransferase [Patescibacteria group bacterium]